MYWTIAEYFWNRFRRKPKQSNNSYAILYDQLIQKYQVSISGNESFSLGREFINKDDAESYVENVLKPQFQNLRAEFDSEVQKNIETYTKEICNIKEEIILIESDLDESNLKGELGKLEKEKREIELRVNELEHIYCPEKKMIPYVKETIIQFKENLNKVTASINDDNIVREFAEKQKAVTAFAYRESGNLKKILSFLAPNFKDMHYPPRLSMIWFFYSICILLLVCEVGVSMRIIFGFTTFIIPNEVTGYIFSAIYGIGISITLAVIFKILIENFIYARSKNLFLFILAYMFFTICMITFFAAENPDIATSLFSLKKIFTSRAILLGILSTSFSIANALLFREATRLKDQYNKLYPNRNLKSISRSKKRLRVKYLKKLNQKNNELLDTIQVSNSFKTDHVSPIVRKNKYQQFLDGS
jgi:hypothetical protein